ncbi:unnamed protein product [Auanema sp. JU1783]|nr:unnamed protein product [Auanema sp. JU1783]
MLTGQKIGIASAISYCVGDIVGSGIFVSPTSILKHTGSLGLSLVVWALCAAISLFGALCYMELGTAIKKSGNDFAYLSHFGWRPFASAFMWVSAVLSYPATMAIQTITLGEYVVAGFGSSLQLDERSTFFAERLIGFSVLWPLMLLNFYSLKNVAGRFQVVATIAKVLVAGIIIVTGFYYLCFKGYTQNFHHSFEGSSWRPGNIVLGIYSGLFAYNGWDVLNFGAEEVENPKRTLPIAAFAGIGISALVFISMNISYFTVLTVDEFKSADAVAVKFASETLGNFQYAVPFLIALLLTGNLNSTIFACSRYLYAGALRGVVPTAIRGFNPTSMSPRVSIFIQVCVGIGISFIGNLDHIISYMSFALWAQRTMTQAGFLYWKWKGWLDGPDVFKVPFFVPCVFFCICLALLIIPIVQDFYVAIYGLSLIVVGFIIYFLFIYPATVPKFLKRIDSFLLKVSQIVFNCIPADLVVDDGMEMIPCINEHKTKV